MSDPLPGPCGDRESRALLAAMQPYFSEDGITLHYEKPERWLAAARCFADLPTASLDRVVGRNVDALAARRKPARPPCRRLQNEMQMLLYPTRSTTPRGSAGVPPSTRSGSAAPAPCQQLPCQAGTAPKPVLCSLRASRVQMRLARLGSKPGKPWMRPRCAALLATLSAQAADVQLTLCGERSAQTFDASAPPAILNQTFISLFGSQPPSRTA